jgi:hypothetical protein
MDPAAAGLWTSYVYQQDAHAAALLERPAGPLRHRDGAATNGTCRSI